MEVDHTIAAMERVENLWFDDGSVVIKAQTKLFRVSRGILAAQSAIFADMFRVPQLPGAEQIHGCPVVNMPYQARDVTVFFRAMFDSS